MLMAMQMVALMDLLKVAEKADRKASLSVALMVCYWDSTLVDMWVDYLAGMKVYMMAVSKVVGTAEMMALSKVERSVEPMAGMKGEKMVDSMAVRMVVSMAA